MTVPATRVEAWAIEDLPELTAGTDLGVVIGDAVAARAAHEPSLALVDGDILSVTSKIVSKAEGRQIAAADREAAITAQTVRVVARRAYEGHELRIVENRLGIVAAAAGVDASNTPDGIILLLPEDPDRSARELREQLQSRFGVRIGVVITDTLGRPWRIGQTDVAIGAAGILVVDDLRGVTDRAGRTLAVTMPAVADEIAAMTDLVKGKTAGRPVAVVRGLAGLVTDEDGPGARAIVREADADLFRLGTAEAYAEGFAAGRATNTRP